MKLSKVPAIIPTRIYYLSATLNFNLTPGDEWRFERHFPFWAKVKIVITTSCDGFCENFVNRNLDH